MPTIGDAISRYNEVKNLVEFFGMDPSILERATHYKKELVKAQFPNGISIVQMSMTIPINEAAMPWYKKLLTMQR